MGLSIIIPTLNESKSLPATLACVQQLTPPAHEVIIVDGGSINDTLNIARRFDVKIIQTQRASRALQMNAGAVLATGEYLCFLHADTLVPPDLVTVIQQTLMQQKIVLAGFASKMEGPKKVRRLISFLNYAKTYVLPMIFRPYYFWVKKLRILFGDQVMFCRKKDFLLVEGFNTTLSIMEEADLCIRMNRLGHIKQIKRQVSSSDRRLVRWGFAKAFCIWMGISTLWAIGVPNRYLKLWYDDLR